MILAIDPGKGAVDSIGVALFYNTGGLVEIGQYTFEGFCRYLDTFGDTGDYKIEHVVIEDYRIFKKKANAHIGSRVETVQSIGVAKAFCVRYGIGFTLQKSEILVPAQKLFQVKIPDDHTISHQFSALLHGLWYLYGQGIIKSALEEEMLASESLRSEAIYGGEAPLA